MKDDRYSLAYYLRAALVHRWLLLAPAVLVFAGATAWTATQPDIYEGKTVLMAQMARPSDGSFRKAVEATARDMFRGTKERLYGYDLNSRVVTEMNLYPGLRAQSMEAAVVRFRKKLDVVLDPNSSSVTVSFRHEGGERPEEVAAETVNLLAQLFVESQRSAVSQKAVDLKSFVDKRQAERLLDLEEAEAKLESFRAAHLGELPEDRANNLATIAQAEARIENCLDRMQRNQDAIERYETASFQLDHQLTQPDRGEAAGDWLERHLSQHVADLKAQLARELTIYNEGSEQLVKRSAQIDEAEKRLLELAEKHQGEGGSKTKVLVQYLIDMNERRQEDARKDTDLCEQRIEEQRQLKALAEQRIEIASQLETEYAALRRQLDSARSRYNAMDLKQEAISFTVEFQDHDPSVPIEVEQKAFSASSPVGPRRLANSLAGLILGLGLGGGLVLVRTRLDRTFRRGEDLRYLLPGTVLVTIPEVSGTGKRAGIMLANVAIGLVLVGLFLTTVTVLGIQIGWWGDPDMLQPLLRLVGQA